MSVEKDLETVITSIFERAKEESRGTEPWKNLFKASEQGLKSLLSEADHQASRVILKLADVIETKFEIKCSNRLWWLLKALPFAMDKVRNKIQEEQGNACCADKARMVYYEEVLSEINRIKNQK